MQSPHHHRQQPGRPRADSDREVEDERSERSSRRHSQREGDRDESSHQDGRSSSRGGSSGRHGSQSEVEEGDGGFTRPSRAGGPARSGSGSWSRRSASGSTSGSRISPSEREHLRDVYGTSEGPPRSGSRDGEGNREYSRSKHGAGGRERKRSTSGSRPSSTHGSQARAEHMVPGRPRSVGHSRSCSDGGSRRGRRSRSASSSHRSRSQRSASSRHGGHHHKEDHHSSRGSQDSETRLLVHDRAPVHPSTFSILTKAFALALRAQNSSFKKPGPQRAQILREAVALTRPVLEVVREGLESERKERERNGKGDWRRFDLRSLVFMKSLKFIEGEVAEGEREIRWLERRERRKRRRDERKERGEKRDGEVLVGGALPVRETEDDGHEHWPEEDDGHGGEDDARCSRRSSRGSRSSRKGQRESGSEWRPEAPGQQIPTGEDRSSRSQPSRSSKRSSRHSSRHHQHHGSQRHSEQGSRSSSRRSRSHRFSRHGTSEYQPPRASTVQSHSSIPQNHEADRPSRASRSSWGSRRSEQQPQMQEQYTGGLAADYYNSFTQANNTDPVDPVAAQRSRTTLSPEDSHSVRNAHLGGRHASRSGGHGDSDKRFESRTSEENSRRESAHTGAERSTRREQRRSERRGNASGIPPPTIGPGRPFGERKGHGDGDGAR